MYLSHFGLNQSPFGITPNPAFFYAGSKRGAILEALIYAVTHGEGIIKVTGEVGSGKTMLCRMLENMLPSNVEVIYLVNPTLSREEVVYAIAGELDLAIGGKRPDEVIRLLQNDLITKHAAGKQVVLLVEEAQAMPLDTLEEIRLFSNLETAHHKLLQIVLFGQPELDENLALPRMRQLKERITHSFKVPPLPPTVIPEFLMFRMRAAGYHGPDIFRKSAIKLLSDVSEGIVRRISILADKSLLAAFADNTHTIQARHVKAAIRDSEFSSSARHGRHWKTLIAMGLATGLVLVVAIGWKVFWPAVTNQLSSARGAPVAFSAPAPRPAAAIVATPAAILPSAVVVTAPTQSKTAESNSIAARAAPKTTAATAVAPAAASLLQQRLSLSKTWLEKEAPERYTIQITTLPADDGTAIERFLIRTQSEIGIDELYLYPSRIDGVPSFGIIFSSFATRPEAQAERVALSKQWAYRPKLRTITGLREEIKRSRSEGLWPQ